jgi:hypothetical protein
MSWFALGRSGRAHELREQATSGHTNLTTTSHYLKIHRRGLQLAMEKLAQHQEEPARVAQG